LSIEPTYESAAVRRTVTLQALTIGWMLLECGISLIAAVRARSLPMAAFGADSFVELLSAGVVALQFGGRLRIAPRTAARAASVLLVILAGTVLMLSLLAARLRIVPEQSYLGIGITVAALAMMPVLAALKRTHAHATGDRALAADAVQSATCAYLAAITLVSLLVQAVHPRWWIDSIAIGLLLPLLLVEARRAWREGVVCACG
jgi:hypothetical protein